MKHEKIVGKLSEYRDGALDPAERETISRHVAGCGECAATLSDWTSLARAFYSRPPARTAFQTEAFVARVMARLPAAGAETLPWLSRWMIPALGLSFGLLALSFLPNGRADNLDPASVLLLSRADRGVSYASRSETPATDALGFSGEDR